VTNDYADVTRDNDITTVFNTGVLFFRAGDRAIAFVREWALRTELTGLIGNDQTELNRLMTGQYADGDTSCRIPDCLLSRKPSVPSSASYEADAQGLHPCPTGAADTGAADTLKRSANGVRVIPCVWRAEPSIHDAHTNLTSLQEALAHHSLAHFHEQNVALGRRACMQRVSHWMWGSRVRVGLLPMAQFMQGHTYFVQHLHEQTRIPPVHVHVTYTLSGDYGKRFRLRSAGLWQAETSEYYEQGNFLHVVGLEDAVLALLRAQSFPDGVWRCAPGEVPSRFFDNVPADQLGFAPNASGLCYHPSHFVPTSVGVGSASIDYEKLPDPAAPHVRLQHLTRLVVRNALALASATKRRLVLPTLWCMCDRYWWHLDDCRMPGAKSLTMPFACPTDLAFNIDNWEGLLKSRVQFVEAAFLDNPRTHADIRAPAAARTLRVARDSLSANGDRQLPDAKGSLAADGSPTGVSRPLVVPSGSAVEEVVETLVRAPDAGGARVLRVSAASLLRLSPCGFREEKERRAFEAAVLPHAFGGQHSYCGKERNPNLGLVISEARRMGMPDEQALTLFRNCTGNPANAFNKPKVDLGPEAMRFLGDCGGAAGADGRRRSPATRMLDAVLAPAVQPPPARVLR